MTDYYSKKLVAEIHELNRNLKTLYLVLRGEQNDRRAEESESVGESEGNDS